MSSKNKFSKAIHVSCVASTKFVPQPFCCMLCDQARKLFLELTVVHSGLRGLLAVTVSSNQRIVKRPADAGSRT